MASEKVTALIEEIKELTVLELADLVKELEEEFGVSAAAPVAVAAAPGAAADAAADDADAEFDVVLTDVGSSKMNVIRLVRDLTGEGLKEAKELVDNAPSTIKEALDKDAAEEMKAQFEEVGATVELK